MAPKFAGLDVSTQSCKLIVIDIETQKIFFDSSVNYDHDFPEYRTENGVIQNKGFGISESDPKMWVDAINALFQQLSKVSSLISDIRAISVSGQQHGLVTLTSKGKLSRPYSKLWNDFSTQEECKILTEKIGGKKSMIESISNTQRTGYTAPKILHLFRNEPERYQRTK